MGILGKVSGLLPGNKNGGYYLQLDESGEVVAPESNIKAAAPAKVEAATPAKETNGNGKTSQKTSVKDSKKAKKEEAVAATPAPTPVVAKKPEVVTETNFATKYLISNGSMARRRPGANMTAFMDMATQVKTPMN
jgi:hypothetical protein